MCKILIIKLSSLGDIIHTFPVPYLIKKHIRNAEIHWITEKSYHELISLNEYVDRIHDIEIRALKKSPGNLFRELAVLKSLRKLDFDYSLDLQGNMKSGIVSRIINAEKRIGFEKKACQEPVNSLFNNMKAIIPENNMHIVIKNLKQLELLNIDDTDILFPVKFSQKMEEEAKALTGNLACLGRPVIGISLFAGFKTKTIPLSTWENTIAGIQRSFKNANILLFWGPGEYDALRVFYDNLAQGVKKSVFILPPTSILESFYFINLTDIFIASDTGPLHIADAMKKKVIGIYTSTSPDRNGPYYNIKNTIKSTVPCSPCRKRKCSDPVCADTIRSQEIIDKISGLL